MLMETTDRTVGQCILFEETYVPPHSGKKFQGLVNTSASGDAKFILEHRDCFEEQSEYCWFTLTSPREHGFTEGYDLLKFYEAVIASGMRVVPAGAGPVLRNLYQLQPEGESIHIGMTPVPDSGGGLNVFSLGHHLRGNGLWLSTLRWHYEIRKFLPVDTPWLFGL